MTEKDLLDSFENKKFLEFSIYFYEKPMSISEVHNLTGISRKTITDKLNLIAKDYLEIEPKFTKEKFLKLKNSALLDWLKNQLDLNTEEYKYLKEFIEENTINNILRKKNERLWGSVLVKLLMIFELCYTYLKHNVKNINLQIFSTLNDNEFFKPYTEKEIQDLALQIRKRIVRSSDKKILKTIAEKFIENDKFTISFTPREFYSVLIKTSEAIAKSFVHRR